MPKLHHSRALAILFALLLCWQTPVVAQSGMTLQVSASGSQVEAVEFGLAELDAMEQVEFSTSTIWTDSVVTFSGVPLKVLIDSVDADGTAVEMAALNDYKVVMQLDDIEDNAPIVATRMDGKTMPVRDKGPYWVVFPFDKGPKYQTETIHSLSIWQLNRLKVIE